MTDISRSNSDDGAQQRRRRPWLIALGGLATLLVLQSLTITLPIAGRVVDGTSGQPVSHAAVAALWQLEAWSPLQMLPGGAVKVAETLTDEKGEFEFPLAIMVHLPLLPFSVLSRSDVEMPVLIVVADGYQPNSATNDVDGIRGPRHASGFLSVRTSSLRGAVLRLVPQSLVGDQPSEYQGNLGWARTTIDAALASCASRFFCKRDPLVEVREAIERGVARR